MTPPSRLSATRRLMTVEGSAVNPYKPGSRRWADVERLGLETALSRARKRDALYRQRVRTVAIQNDTTIAKARRIRREAIDRQRVQRRASDAQWQASKDYLLTKAAQRAYSLIAFERGPGWEVENPFSSFLKSIRAGKTVRVETAPGRHETVNIRAMVRDAERGGFQRRRGSAYERLLLFIGSRLEYDSSGTGGIASFRNQTPTNIVLPWYADTDDNENDGEEDDE